MGVSSSLNRGRVLQRRCGRVSRAARWLCRNFLVALLGMLIQTLCRCAAHYFVLCPVCRANQVATPARGIPASNPRV